MKQLLFVIIYTVFAVSLFGQKNNSHIDIRLGAGFSFLGSGDKFTNMLENELNYTINNYLTFSPSLAVGITNGNYKESGANLVHVAINIFLSPFRSNRFFDFRIGTGVNAYKVFDYTLTYARYNSSGELIDYEYSFDSRKSIGINILIENTIRINKNLLVGIKLFSTPYRNADINSGILLKFGVRI